MPDKVTSLDLKLAHEEWRKERDQHRHALNLWGQWYREVGGPEAWGEFAEMVRRRGQE